MFAEEHGLYISEPYEDHGGYNMQVFPPAGMVFRSKVYGSRGELEFVSGKSGFLWSSSTKGHATLTEPNWLECLDQLKKWLPLKQSTFAQEVWFMGAEQNYSKCVEQALQSGLNLMVPQKAPDRPHH
jgi:hypothetical protein